MLEAFWRALGGDSAELTTVATQGEGELPSAFPVTDLAVASIASAGLSIAELLRRTDVANPLVQVDRRLASLWFLSSIRPVGWSIPAPWDAIAGDYAAADGWIRLHTNAPKHRLAVRTVLGGADNRESVARAVARWSKTELELAVVEANGCAAEMRSFEEWTAHPQGAAVAKEPLVYIHHAGSGARTAWAPNPMRPLAGIRVLDLTRVLAGPVATRFLAGFGAEVLRIDPPDWDEPAVVPDVTLGKRCARLDLRNNDHRTIFEDLLAKADILLHGYRPGALDGLGYDLARRRRISPGLIDVSLNAYGWTGPWCGRRGFDSLVQMSSGIADAGMKWQRAAKPLPLPAQALDHATGYLLAATAIRGLTARFVDGVTAEALMSLARTAVELLSRPRVTIDALDPWNDNDYAPQVESTAWGQARRLLPPMSVEGAPMAWDFPASPLGTATASWLSPT